VPSVSRTVCLTKCDPAGATWWAPRIAVLSGNCILPQGVRMRTRVASDLKFAIVSVASLAATSLQGQLATYPNLVPWYAELTKPNFNPPDWVFAPVWTCLYVLMAFSLWRVLRMPASSLRRTALILFGCVLILNVTWSWMFFGANSPLLGLINIGPQVAVIAVTIAFLWSVDRVAAFCLLPLAGWVTFAALLNFSIWRLNA
jgi:translocator protein